MTFFPTSFDLGAVLRVGSSADHPAPEVRPALTEVELAERILALPEVTQVQASEEIGAPEISWGDRFFYVGPDSRWPFATIVGRDVPGFDEDSHLDRPGVFRLNIGLGRQEFARQFGFPPAELDNRGTGIDFTQLDEVIPHPAYGRQGWASILNPSPGSLPEIDRLLAGAHRRALNRRRAR